jgi:hypothetical protein
MEMKSQNKNNKSNNKETEQRNKQFLKNTIVTREKHVFLLVVSVGSLVFTGKASNR